MKRDMDLVRKILFAIEASEKRIPARELKIEGYTNSQIQDHLLLLKDAGLLAGPPAVIATANRTEVTTFNHYNTDSEYFFITWDGYEFLEVARNETAWTKAKSTVTKSAGGMVFEFLKNTLFELGRRAINEQLGLPQ